MYGLSARNMILSVAVERESLTLPRRGTVIYLSTHRSLAPSGWKISHSPSVLNIPILILDALQNQFFSFFFGSKKVAETLFS